jgi:hypothetical protein
VQVNAALKSLLPPEGGPGYHRAADKLDNAELIRAMRDIIGIGENGPEMEGDHDCLLWMFWRAVISCDPGVAPLARSCLLTVRLAARI